MSDGWEESAPAWIAEMGERGGYGRERFFSEPAPRGGDPAKAAHYRRVPFFVVMEWRKVA